MSVSWRRLPLTTVALGLLSTAIVAFVTQRIMHGTQTPQLLATAAKKYAASVVPLAVPHTHSDLQGIRNQPLFYASRSFYVPPPPSAMPSTPLRPEYLLSGTLIIPRKPTVALLKHRSGAEVRKVTLGDDLDGWRVQAVERARVVLDYQGVQIEIARDSQAPTMGLVRAPIVRAGLNRAPLASAPSSATDTAPRSIRTLGGAGVTHTASRSGASAPPLQMSLEKRLYRPPPQ